MARFSISQKTARRSTCLKRVLDKPMALDREDRGGRVGGFENFEGLMNPSSTESPLEVCAEIAPALQGPEFLII